MANLQGRAGSLVPYNPSAHRRVLLPAEAALCNILGLSEDEYWYFVELTDAYNGKRAAAYELAGVPDVVNIPVVPVVISLVVGVATSAVGAAMTPKPKPLKTEQQQQQQAAAPQLKTANIQGNTRFATNSGFDSVQALAGLGEVIPLVFANRRGDVGGIRIKTVMLWSQLLSFGTGQQLKILTLLSAGELAAEPEFAGYAIGDQTLKNYTRAKVGLYRRLMGGRIVTGDKYPEGTIIDNPVEDIFTVYDDINDSYKTWFSGNRTTSTQTSFGCYNSMPNATPYKLPYELIMNPSNIDQGIRNDNNNKHDKMANSYRPFAAINSADATSCTYYINGGGEDPNGYPPYGLADVNKATEDKRNFADDNIQIGALYMAGTAHVVCVDTSTDVPWTLGKEKTYTFKIEEPGTIKTFSALGRDNKPWGYILQRLAIGTISNNRECHVTEIGIRSNVWKQISGFANVNSQPYGDVISSYEQRNGTIQLGTIQRYVTRFSFFKLEARALGVEDAWQDISGGKLFCIQGNSPQDQYNFLRVVQPFGQHEYRLLPVPGAAIVDQWQKKEVYRLSPGALMRHTTGQYTVSFTGSLIKVLIEKMTNSDWTLGPAKFQNDPVVDINPKSHGGGPPPPVYDDSSNSWIEVRPTQTLIANTKSNQGTGLTLHVNVWEFFDVDANPLPPIIAWTIKEAGRDYVNGGQVSFTALGMEFFANVVVGIQGDSLPNSLNDWDAVADIGLYDAEGFSNENGPEHELVYVNEIVRQDTAPQYDGMALIGLRLNASKEWASFQQLSAYVKKGIKVDRLIDDDGAPTATLYGPTNNFAEIAYTLLTDHRLGAGEVLGSAATSRDRMTQAAQFCRANGFTWDGAIGQKLNLRDFIFDNAGYCLLDFTILGGQFSLVPSVPVTSSHQIDNAAEPPISALFTDGNIRELTVSWLSPEERQLFKAVVKWRQEIDNGFSQERMFSMRLSDDQGGSDNDGEEVFDLTGFCTTQQQASIFAKYALKLRKEVDHGLQFETTPQAAMGLEPGAYFRLVSEVTHTSRFNNGSIDSVGFITSTQTMADGIYSVLSWRPGTVGISEDQMVVSDGKTTNAGLFGRVFTLKNSTTTSRVYKVESLSYGQDGFIEISGSYQPLTSTGSLATLDWSDSHFVVEIG